MMNINTETTTSVQVTDISAIRRLSVASDIPACETKRKNWQQPYMGTTMSYYSYDITMQK
jgi:hypothetical protein